MHAVPDENGVLVLQGDTPVLYYQRTTKSLDGKWPRAGYVHPLHDLNGNVISEDFPADHGHHRGIFWAWHQVWIGDKQIGDPWLCKDFVWDVTDVETSSHENAASIRADVQWKSPTYTDASGEMIPIVRERTNITVHAAQPSYRLIDFDISLLALVEQVRIGGSEDDKGYGGFSPRIELTHDQRFIASDGEIEPTKTAIAAGDWINIVGDDRGLAILTHAENPVPRGQWILRRQKSMQNAVYPGRDPVPMSTKQPTRLRYRLVIHRGDLSSETIRSLQRDYQP